MQGVTNPGCPVGATMPSPLERLEAHIACLREMPTKALPPPPAPVRVTAPAKSPSPASPRPAVPGVPGHLDVLDGFFASLQQDAPPSEAIPAAATVTEAPDRYDKLVRQSVRRAWDLAWSTFQLENDSEAGAGHGYRGAAPTSARCHGRSTTASGRMPRSMTRDSDSRSSSANGPRESSLSPSPHRHYSKASSYLEAHLAKSGAARVVP